MQEKIIFLKMSSHRDALTVKGNNAVHLVQLENRLCSKTHFYAFFQVGRLEETTTTLRCSSPTTVVAFALLRKRERVRRHFMVSIFTILAPTDKTKTHMIVHPQRMDIF